ncbi:hypothetical protein EYZ49_12620 [Salmonella enterica subsp. salamae serovar 13,22:z:-]|uniref:hypothetical protein n=1 Tax=Salmonella enterica TaxID=28901 RepID=UPI001033646B|nr:hypothetical protein [Salmonella enterica]TBN98602.1 hypothetical protein EYZ49_12620 [Salmonella enterica subsp. salamae serovar 13,22:z:-]
MMKQYTNELTADVLAEQNESSFSAKELADMSDDARAVVLEQEAFCRAHPVTAIYRVAVAGCLTRRGGTGAEFNPNPEEGYKIRLENGQWVSVLTEGCTVTYPDGSTARIISSAGKQHTYDGRGIALVGSVLDNGDEIISTPQNSLMIVARDGVPMGDDFLAVSGV